MTRRFVLSAACAILAVAGDAPGAASWIGVGPTRPPPPPPVILMPTAGGTTAATTISGTTSNGTTVEVFDGGSSLGMASVTGTAWTLAHALPDGLHVVTAIARHGSNASAPSVAVAFTLDTVPPVAPAAVSGPTPTTAQPSLSWTPVSGAVRYDVFRDGVMVGATAAPPYVDPSVGPAAATYAYTVVSVDAAGNASAPSAPFHIAHDATWPSHILIVGPGGFSDIGAALAATTSQNAIIKVAGGTYPAFDVPFMPTGSIRILADGSGAVSVNTSTAPIRLIGTGADAVIALSDLTMAQAGGGGHPALDIANCAGLVVIDECVINGGADPGAIVRASERTVFQRSHAHGAPGLRADQASFVIVGNGSVSDAHAQGGSVIRCSGVTIQGSASPGSWIHHLPGIMPDIDAPDFAATGELVTISFSGAPLTEWLLASTLDETYRFGLDPAPDVHSVLLLALPAVVVTLRMTNATGHDAVTIQIPTHPYYLGRAMVLQAAGVEPALQQYRLSNAITVVAIP